MTGELMAGRLSIAVVALAILAAGRPPALSRPAATVTMTDQLTFVDDTVRISVGETVQWRNTSVLVHTVTADPARAASEENVRLPPEVEPFGSGRLGPGETFSRTFDVPGVYRYVCLPHEPAGMVGTVLVQPSSDLSNTSRTPARRSPS